MREKNFLSLRSLESTVIDLNVALRVISWKQKTRDLMGYTALAVVFKLQIWSNVWLGGKTGHKVFKIFKSYAILAT